MDGIRCACKLAFRPVFLLDLECLPQQSFSVCMFPGEHVSVSRSALTSVDAVLEQYSSSLSSSVTFFQVETFLPNPTVANSNLSIQIQSNVSIFLHVLHVTFMQYHLMDDYLGG